MTKPATGPGYKKKITLTQEKIIIALIKQSRAENGGKVAKKTGIIKELREKYKLTHYDIMRLMTDYGIYRGKI